MEGRMVRRIKMLRLCPMTAARLLIAVFGAVFFASSGSAVDGSLHGLENSLTELVFGLSRSVVTVEASRRLPASRFGGVADETYTKEFTTGIVVDSGGLILVAARPVLGRDRLTVRFESQSMTAELVAIDFQTELALLRTSASGGVPVSLVNRQTCAGQMVIAVGHAYGFRSSPSLGFCAGIRDDGVMQFTVPNLGNRPGTGVFDLSGRLLGVVTGLLGPDPAVAVAVPAHRIPQIVDHLLNQGDRQSGFAGITSQEIEITPGLTIPRTATMAAASRFRPTVIERGVVVTSVVPASPASRAGLNIGDLIVAVNSMAVNSAAGLASLVRQSLPGTRLQLDILRQDQFVTLPLIVGRKSLNLASDAVDVRSTPAQRRLVDSLREALELMRSQLNYLESRLDGLD